MSHDRSDVQLRLIKDVISLSEVREEKEAQQKFFNKKKVLALDIHKALENVTDQLAHKVRVEQENNRILQEQNELLKSSSEKLNLRVERLASTNEQIIDKVGTFIADGVKPDIKVCPSNKDSEFDLAIAKFGCPSEAYYTKYSYQIVDAIGNGKLTPSVFGQFMRKFKLYGDSRFHIEEPSGRKAKQQKYHPSVIKEIYERLSNPARYGITQSDADKFAQYIKPSQAVILS